MTPVDPELPLVTDVTTLLADQGAATYRQFLTVPALSVGLFAVERGHRDSQQPHQQDEVYVVMSGQAVLDVDGARTPVAPGSVFSPPYDDEG